MDKPNTVLAYLCYTYDGEDETVLMDVAGNTREERIQDGERQARKMLEEGISFDVFLAEDDEMEPA